MTFFKFLFSIQVILCGGMVSVRKDPPAVVVEVCSEDFSSSETFLGRFMTTPSVISLATDRRGTPTWFPLSFRKGKQKYSIQHFIYILTFQHFRNVTFYIW